MMIRLMERFNKCVGAHLNTLKDRDLQEYSQFSKKPREISPEFLDLLEDNLSKLIV